MPDMPDDNFTPHGTLLHKSAVGRGSPFPRRIHSMAFVTRMPRAV
jgi:hypothetical protein